MEVEVSVSRVGDLTKGSPDQKFQAAKPRYVNYDGLRGLAALAVMLFHCSERMGLGQAVPNGYLAVDFFFALSGFVIAEAYIDRLKGGMSVFRFMLLRFVRIYPVYIIGLLGGCIFFVGAASFHIQGIGFADVGLAFLFGITFLPISVELGLFPPILPLDGPAWSLSFELLVNFVFALIVMHLNRRCLSALIVISGLFLIAAANYWGQLHLGWTTSNLAGALPRVFFSFFLGIALYKLRPQTRFNNVMAVIPAVMLLAIFFLGTPSAHFDLAATMIVFPLVIYLGAWFEPLGRLASIYNVLGEISFPAYVLHMPISLFAKQIFVRLHLHGNILLIAWGVTLIGIAVISWVVARYYDRPVRAYLNKQLKKS